MARSSNTDASEAFELFLDTASNAFGGILFIALLVCILLQLSGAGGASEKPMDPYLRHQLERKLGQLTTQAEGLKEQQERQQQILKSLLGPPSDRGLIVTYAELTAEEQQQLTRLLALTKEATEVKNQVLTQRQLLDQLREQQRLLEEGKKLVAGLLLELGQVKKAGAKGGGQPPQKVRVPIIQPLKGEQVAVLLSGKRLSFVFDYDASGNRKDLNTADVVRGPKGISPRPGRGQPVQDPDSVLQRRLARLPPSNNFLAIAVYPDSFPECELIRDWLISHKYHYALWLMKQGEPVPIGPGGSSAGF